MPLKKAFSLIEIVVAVLIVGMIAGFLSQALSSNFFLNKKLNDAFVAQNIFYEIESDIRIFGLHALAVDSQDSETIINALIQNPLLTAVSEQDSLATKLAYFNNHYILESAETLSIITSVAPSSSSLVTDKLINLHPSFSYQKKLLDRFPGKDYQLSLNAQLIISNNTEPLVQNSHYQVNLTLTNNQNNAQLASHSFNYHPYPNQQKQQHKRQLFSNQCLIYRLLNGSNFPESIESLYTSEYSPQYTFLHPYASHSYADLESYFNPPNMTDKVFSDWQFASPLDTSTLAISKSCRVITKSRTHYFDAGYHSYSLPSFTDYLRIHIWGSPGLETGGNFSSQIFKINAPLSTIKVLVGQSQNSVLANSLAFWQNCNGFGCPSTHQAGSSAIYEHDPVAGNHRILLHSLGGKHITSETLSNPFDADQIFASSQSILEACPNTLIQLDTSTLKTVYDYTPLIEETLYNYDTYQYEWVHTGWARDTNFDNLRYSGWGILDQWWDGYQTIYCCGHYTYTAGIQGEYRYNITGWLYGTWNGWTGWTKWWYRDYKTYSYQLVLQDQIRNSETAPPVGNGQWYGNTYYVVYTNSYITTEGERVIAADALPADPNTYTDEVSYLIPNNPASSIAINNFIASTYELSLGDNDISDNTGYVIIEPLIELNACPIENNVVIPNFNQVYEVSTPAYFPAQPPFQ